MIFVLARDSADAREWASFNGLTPRDYVLGGGTTLQGRRLFPEDRVVRTARFRENPEYATIERELSRSLTTGLLTETVHGRLVNSYHEGQQPVLSVFSDGVGDPE